MPHAQKACQKEEEKDAYPKKVCHMPTRHVQKKEKRIEKDSPHPRKIKKREESWKGVHPPKKTFPHTCTS